MEEVKVWKEVQQQQQWFTNEVPGSHCKPLLTDIARGQLCSVCDYVCLLVSLRRCGEFACASVDALVDSGKMYSNSLTEY